MSEAKERALPDPKRIQRWARRVCVGMALIGRRLDEATALRAAHTFQQATDWHGRSPPEAA